MAYAPLDFQAAGRAPKKLAANGYLEGQGDVGGRCIVGQMGLYLRRSLSLQGWDSRCLVGLVHGRCREYCCFGTVYVTMRLF